MTNHLIKVAGIWALSAITVTGVSLFATKALAAEADENDDAAIVADDDVDNDIADADEDATAESNDAIIYRGWYRYPGFYYRWPGYRLYPNPYYSRRYYRYYYPRPVPYFRSPFYGGPACGPYGCVR